MHLRLNKLKQYAAQFLGNSRNINKNRFNMHGYSTNRNRSGEWRIQTYSGGEDCVTTLDSSSQLFSRLKSSNPRLARGFDGSGAAPPPPGRARVSSVLRAAEYSDPGRSTADMSWEDEWREWEIWFRVCLNSCVGLSLCVYLYFRKWEKRDVLILKEQRRHRFGGASDM